MEYLKRWEGQCKGGHERLRARKGGCVGLITKAKSNDKVQPSSKAGPVKQWKLFRSPLYFKKGCAKEAGDSRETVCVASMGRREGEAQDKQQPQANKMLYALAQDRAECASECEGIRRTDKDGELGESQSTSLGSDDEDQGSGARGGLLVPDVVVWRRWVNGVESGKSAGRRAGVD